MRACVRACVRACMGACVYVIVFVCSRDYILNIIVCYSCTIVCSILYATNVYQTVFKMNMSIQACHDGCLGQPTWQSLLNSFLTIMISMN